MLPPRVALKRALLSIPAVYLARRPGSNSYNVRARAVPLKSRLSLNIVTVALWR
jgi:hypothetical protein